MLFLVVLFGFLSFGDPVETVIAHLSRSYFLRSMGIIFTLECGLDYSGRNRVPREQQVAVFRAQVRLVRRLRLPLVLHIREAEEDGRRVLREEGLPRGWAVHRHCFTGEVVGGL